MVNRKNSWRSWLWPAQCLLCRAQTSADHGLCAACHAGLPWLTSSCPRCAAPLHADAADAPCGKCQQREPPFDRTYAALHYTTPVDRWVTQLKYRRRLDLARILGEFLAAQVIDTAVRPDAIVPVPLHMSRLRKRGYNQSLEIARVIGKRMDVPLLAAAARRQRVTAPQTSLPLAQRARNVRRAFVAHSDVAGKHIAIVDDVMTSGHTVSALAKALRRAGATSVSVWVVARVD